MKLYKLSVTVEEAQREEIVDLLAGRGLEVTLNAVLPISVVPRPVTVRNIQQMTVPPGEHRLTVSGMLERLLKKYDNQDDLAKELKSGYKDAAGVLRCMSGTSVSGWLHGQRPNGKTMQQLKVLYYRHFGCPVELTDWLGGRSGDAVQGAQ